jgi:hypothetical protein
MGASRLRLHPHEEVVAADGTRPQQIQQVAMMGRPRLGPVSEVQPTLRRCRAPPSLRVRTLLQTGKQTRFLVAVRCPSRRTLLGQARPPAPVDQPPLSRELALAGRQGQGICGQLTVQFSTLKSLVHGPHCNIVNERTNVRGVWW